MEYNNVVKDFAHRTQQNLKLIEQEKSKGNEAYEITQLINSCLGLLVLPQQRFMESIPETPIIELEQDGWAIPKVTGQFPQVQNLRELIRYLRNAIAHFNIEFLSDYEKEIQSIKVWNKSGGKTGKTTWEATLGLKELKSILFKFTELLDK